MIMEHLHHRKDYLFAGSDAGVGGTAVINMLGQTQRSRPGSIPTRGTESIVDYLINRIEGFLPWNLAS